MLQIYWIYLFVLTVFDVFRDFLCINSYYVQKETISLYFPDLDVFYFFLFPNFSG